MKAAALLTSAGTGVPCPTKESLGEAGASKGRNGGGAASAPPKAPTVEETLSTLGSALSWRAPLVVLPYVLYLAWVYRTSVDEVNPFGQVTVLAPAIGTSAYLAMIFLGKKWMAGREAFEPREWMVVYNAYQTLFNMFAVGAFIYFVWELNAGVWGIKLDLSTPRQNGIGFVVWLHYNNKFLEFADTLFMVLRKKNKQVSFLHVYHHYLLVWAWFFVCKYACGGDAYFGAVMNSFIHVVMYGYYLLSLLKLPCPWKKYVTQLQLVQFVICATHASYIVYLGNDVYPTPLAWLDIFVMANMFVLFTNFYIQSYKKSAAAKKAAKDDAAKELANGGANGHANGKAEGKKTK